jgi:hypothetical protein
VFTAPNGASALSALASYLLEASEGRPEDLRDFFRELAPRAEEFAVTAAEKLRAQGIEEGRERGRVELLLRLLTLRFGPLSPEVQARVGSAAPVAVELWAERVLSATSLDEIFR